MIKKILLPIIAIIFLSSCSNKFSLQKRKYTKGFYFANSKNNKHNDLASNTKNTNAKKLTTKIYVETKENKIDADIKKQPISEISLINIEYP